MCSREKITALGESFTGIRHAHGSRFYRPGNSLAQPFEDKPCGDHNKQHHWNHHDHKLAGKVRDFIEGREPFVEFADSGTGGAVIRRVEGTLCVYVVLRTDEPYHIYGNLTFILQYAIAAAESRPNPEAE